jgi:hypothetical protein
MLISAAMKSFWSNNAVCLPFSVKSTAKRSLLLAVLIHASS